MSKPTIDFEETSRDIRSNNLVQNAGGLIARQPYYRGAFEVNKRAEQVMTWQLPSGDAIQMYINPQNFVIRDSKQITETRTKGGFVIQYWGENLTQLTIDGTTGSSGIRGISVLRDIYRSENKGFDLVAQQQLQEIERVQQDLNTDEDINQAFSNAAQNIQERNFLLRPSLAALATNVLLFYQGVQYKGFFRDFTVTESVNNLGLFDYSMTFMATERRGQRKNFMSWHKEPLADDIAGQLINGVGNAFRGAVGLQEQPPESFHPANAPYTFGGSSISGSAGIRASQAGTIDTRDSLNNIFI